MSALPPKAEVSLSRYDVRYVPLSEAGRGYLIVVGLASTSAWVYVHVLSKGAIVHSQPPYELWEREDIKTQYLGL